MADVRPLPALRYAEPLGPVVAPPYDVLTEQEVAAFRAASPHNVVHLTRPGSDYEGAASLLRRWVAEGVLVEEARHVMYVHETRFGAAGEQVRRDLICALRLEPYHQRVVLPHERTHAGPKEDRLALLQTTGVALEPLWFLTRDLGAMLDDQPAPVEVREFGFAGERHVLRTIADPSWLARVSMLLAERPVLIADGHHRYETTLLFSQEVGGDADAASRFTLALLTDLADPGLVVLPTHRVMTTGVAVTGGEPAGSLGETLTAVAGGGAAGYYREGAYQVLPLEGDVGVLELHRQVVDNLLGRRDPEQHLLYTRDAVEAVRWVDEGRGVAAFFLGAPDVAGVLAAAEQGMTMPQKSTYFAPKPPSGMAFHRLDPARHL
jgi:uncharacterized protein (DUF1015 family)